MDKATVEAVAQALLWLAARPREGAAPTEARDPEPVRIRDGRRKSGTESHQGVVLYRRVNPSGDVVWRARFTDPATGRRKHQMLPRGLGTAERRKDWAVKKAQEIMGKPVKQSQPVVGWVADLIASLPVAVPLAKAEQVLNRSRTSVWRDVKMGRLTALRSGRKILITRESIVQFLGGSLG